MVPDTESKAEKELIKMLIDGSEYAFGELYAQYKTRLLYFCKRFLKDSVASEDLIQDVFIQIWNTRDSLTPDLSFSGYIYKIVQNRIYNTLRQHAVHSRFVEYVKNNQEQTDCLTEYQILDNDYTRILNEAIDQLSPQQKKIFRLSRENGYTYKEIAEQLQISVPTIQEHASIALKKIKAYLTQFGDISF
jgi:RNA polymerase sigma-70 factor (ECF subfamily)